MAKTYNNLYPQICKIDNLVTAWKKARKRKTKRSYVIEFEKNINENLLKLQEELINQTYNPKALVTFILRDPKTRKISKSIFKDRIVHHALNNVIEPIFEKIFIYDSCANRKNKGSLFALKRFDLFKRKTTNNFKSEAYCLKADIIHYFQEVDHEILISIIKRKIKDEKVINLIRKILANFNSKSKDIGMPLGNLTSQFFANVYLNELDYFVKHNLKAKYYIRYVDDFVILHESKYQLEIWRNKINKFLLDRLKLKLHPDKSRIISTSRGIDFIGFKIFYYHKLVKKKNIKKIFFIIEKYKKEEIHLKKLLEIFQGWNAYAKWANSFNLMNKLFKLFIYYIK